MAFDIKDLPEADRLQIHESLTAWRESGVEDPLLPLDVDLDGDGIADAFGLDAKGNLELRPGQPIKDTVYVSEGDDIPAVE